jgi:DNA-binding transcriptional LysR family regulator
VDGENGDAWDFTKRRSHAVTVKVNWRVRMDNSDAIRQAASVRPRHRAGRRAGYFPDLWELEDMETLLDGYTTTDFPMYAVYPSRRFVPAKVRAMIDFLEYEIRLDPSMTGGSALI